MPATPVIERIELIVFEVEVANLTADPSGLRIAYTPGRAGPQVRFGVRIHADTGVVGEYVPGRGRA